MSIFFETVQTMPIAAVILAAGQGTRMKSDLPKVLHTIDERPMVLFVIDTVAQVNPERVIVVVGYQGDRVRAACEGAGVEFVVQEQQLGTGHAVMQAEESLSGFNGTTLVLNGDVPCLRPETLQEFVAYHRSSGAAATVMTARMEDPSGYGRIARDADGSLLRIVEHKDASPDELAIDEINSGLFCFDTQALFTALHQTNTSNAQNEYYLTDAIEMLRAQGKRVSAWCVPDNSEVAGVNTIEELDAIRSAMGGRS